MAATQKVMEQLLDGNGEALHLSGELVIAKNKGETFAQHAADTTRHLTTAQVDTAIETALVPIQEELGQIAGGGTGGGDSLKVGDILLTANSKRDLSSFLPADGSRIRAEPYPDLGQVLGTEFVAEHVPSTLTLTKIAQEPVDQGLDYHRLSRSSTLFVAALRGGQSSFPQTKTYRTSENGINWTQRTAPGIYSYISYVNNEWLCVCSSQIYTSSSGISGWSKRSSLPGGSIGDIGYGDGVYFCASAETKNIYISTDAMKTWTIKEIKDNIFPVLCAYKDGCYMIFDMSYMLFSTDRGETWTRTHLSFLVEANYGATSIELGGKLYILATGKVAVFKDPLTWEVHPVNVTSGSSTTKYLGPVTFADGLFIAAFTIAQKSPHAVSTDGLQWTPMSVSLPHPIMGALGTGNGIIITTGYTLISSTGTSRKAGVLCSAPTELGKHYLTLPNVTCPGAKAYVKAL